MGVRVAYGKKSKITSAIASGVIPKDSFDYHKRRRGVRVVLL